MNGDPSPRDTDTSSTQSEMHGLLPNLLTGPFDKLFRISPLPIDFRSWPQLFVPLIPFLCMALLARRPDSSLLRLMVFPVVVLTSLRVALWHVWMEPEYLACNALKSYVCAVLIAKAVDYAFYTDGIQRCNTVVEKVVEVAEDYEIGAGGITSTAPAPRILHPRWPYFDSILSPVSDAIDLACSMRGIGFEHGKGLVIPPESRPLKRKLFLWATFRMFLTRLSITDAIDTVFKLASPFGTPKGGSVFIHTLPWAHRYLLSTFYHILTGCMVIYMFELVYSICTLIAVGIFAQSPEEWPPIFNNPFASESLHEFWGVRWHQILRRVFFLFGGFPGYLIAERLGLSKGRGLLFGTFIASGFYHELPLYALGHGIDYRMPAFFILQAFFMLGERKWKRVTGHPVRGWLGRVWVLVSVIITGQNTFTNSLHERGIGGAMIIPPTISPIRRIVLPSSVWIMERLSNGGSWLS